MIKHLTLPKKMAAMVLLAGAALSIAPVQQARRAAEDQPDG